MFGISLLLGDGFLALPIEQTMVWALFYSTLRAMLLICM